MAFELIEQERILAAWMFADEWRATEGLRSKPKGNRRRALRARAIEMQARSLLPNSACCGNCEHLLINPGGLGGTFCDLDSDYSGYMRTRKSDVCSRWRNSEASSNG